MPAVHQSEQDDVELMYCIESLMTAPSTSSETSKSNDRTSRTAICHTVTGKARRPRISRAWLHEESSVSEEARSLCHSTGDAEPGWNHRKELAFIEYDSTGNHIRSVDQ